MYYLKQGDMLSWCLMVKDKANKQKIKKKKKTEVFFLFSSDLVLAYCVSD